MPSGPPVSASGAAVTSSAAGDSVPLITDVGLGLVGGDDGVIGVDRCDDVVVDIDSGS